MIDSFDLRRVLTFDLVVLDLDEDLSGAELVDALGFAQEHDFEPLSVGVVVDEICQFKID